MIVDRNTPMPTPPPPMFTLTFPRDEGWAIVAALREYAEAHRWAARQDDWLGWARELDSELRRP